MERQPAAARRARRAWVSAAGFAMAMAMAGYGGSSWRMATGASAGGGEAGGAAAEGALAGRIQRLGGVAAGLRKVGAGVGVDEWGCCGGRREVVGVADAG